MKYEDKQLFLKQFVKCENAIEELLFHTENKFTQNSKASLSEETAINTWEEYYQESKEIGAFETLKKYLIQLQFPVQSGISKTEEYHNSTLRGKLKSSKSNLVLNKPESIKLELYDNNIIGKVPLIIVPNNNDFNTIICALSNKNEPQELPKSMGASFINGINNWDRIHRLKTNWLRENPYGNWTKYFKEQIVPNPHLFKDKLIVLSTKGYSGIKNEVLGISKNIWKSSSFVIRREHECTHLFTLKYYGTMANNIHDEIVADYAGITKALGKFNKKWFMHFMGLENYPSYRKGGRLENYKQPNELSKEAFDGLKIIVKHAVDSISEFDNYLGEIKSSIDQLNRIKSICEVNLIAIASHRGTEKLLEKYNNMNIPVV